MTKGGGFMGKNYNCLLRLEACYQRLLLSIRDDVRQAACTIPEFRDSKNGCVQVVIDPLSFLAETWMGGGLSLFGDSFYVDGDLNRPCEPFDGCRRGFAFKIHPEGCYTMNFICEDGHTEPVNCYGYSALKVEYAAWKQKFDDEMRRLKVPKDLADQKFKQRAKYFIAENGYSTDPGALWTVVTLDGVDFIKLCVTVSGAQDGLDDERCAFAGMIAAQKFFERVSESIEAGGYFHNGIPETLEFEMIPDFMSVQDT